MTSSRAMLPPKLIQVRECYPIHNDSLSSIEFILQQLGHGDEATAAAKFKLRREPSTKLSR